MIAGSYWLPCGFVLNISVFRRFSDLDPLGHVNNVAFVDYLQEARVALIGDPALITGPGFAHIVVNHEIHHRSPLGYSREPITIDTWVSSVSRSSYQISYRIIDTDGTLAAEATSTLAVIDPVSGRPIRIPPDALEVLTPHLSE